MSIHACSVSRATRNAPAAASPAAAPRPRASRLLGFAPELKRSQIRTFERVMREQGDLVRLVVGPPGLRFELYCVFDPDGVQRVLAGSREGYSKGTRSYREIARSFGRGLLTSEGPQWQQQRRHIQPLFTRRQVATYSAVMAEEAAALAQAWSRRGAGGAIDAHAEMTGLTLRVVGRAVFGDDVANAGHVLRWAFPLLAEHTSRRAMAPAGIPAKWPTPGNRRAARARRALYGLVDELIARRRASGTDGDDLLSRLLTARDADGQGMEMQQVRDEALVFLLAGHETTSAALTFTLHLLGRHPGQQRRLHEELDRVLAGRPPTHEDVPALTRTTMALKEAMRLYPPAYALGRLAEIDDEIHGYSIPRGAWMVVSQWATHRHPRIWQDAEAFDPDRFTPEREAARHRYAYFPFGAGPRACIGARFAMQEALIALAVLLQRFRVRTVRTRLPLNSSGLTLRPSGPVPIEIARR